MNFLNVRLIVNGKNIYSLPKNKAVFIPLKENHLEVVATDGFHITSPLQLSFQKQSTLQLQVACAIDDNLLITGLTLLIIFSLVGLISDIFLFKILSFIPVFYFLFFYYVKRREFIRVVPSF